MRNNRETQEETQGNKRDSGRTRCYTPLGCKTHVKKFQEKGERKSERQMSEQKVMWGQAGNAGAREREDSTPPKCWIFGFLVLQTLDLGIF